MHVNHFIYTICFYNTIFEKEWYKIDKKNQSRETKVKTKYDQNQPEHYN